MEKLRVGIYGTGLAGFLQVRSLGNCARAEVTAVCGHTKERTEKFAAEHGIEYRVNDYERFLNEAPVDAVFVSTPDHLHADNAIAALAAGKHVLCEKPMCTTIADARRIVAAADAADTVFMAGQVVRFTRNGQKLHEMCAAGELGELFFVEGDYVHNVAHLLGGTWRDDPARPQGPFLGGGCHPLDLMRWIAGDVEEVHAYSNHIALPSHPTDDCFVAIMKFARGCLGKVLVSIACKRPYALNMAAYGTEATIVNDRLFLGIPEDGADFRPLGAPPVRESDAAFFDVEMEHFTACVLDGETPLIDARDGARTVSACLAAERSLETGRPEKVDNDF